MINISFNISNPWSKRWSSVFSKSGKTPFPNKCWEVELIKNSDIIGVYLNLTTKQSHAGLRVIVSLLGYELMLNLCDTRHWDYGTNTWEKHNE